MCTRIPSSGRSDVGESVGLSVGLPDGALDEETEGDSVGLSVGLPDGALDGDTEGDSVGGGVGGGASNIPGISSSANWRRFDS